MVGNMCIKSFNGSTRGLGLIVLSAISCLIVLLHWLHPLTSFSDTAINNQFYLDATTSDSIYYSGILQTTSEICGELCDYAEYSPPAWQNGLWKPRTVKISPQQCNHLLSANLFDAPAVRHPPPTSIPESMKDAYTLNGRVEVRDWYLSSVYAGDSAATGLWTVDLINKFMQRYKDGDYEGCIYGGASARDIHAALRKYSVKGKTALVVGTEVPWLEALLLFEGASMVYTLEYGKIVSEHPHLRTFLPGEYSQLAIENKLPAFDFMLSYSSLEHSGLGRYGDIPNPHGDVIQMAKLWCTAQPHTIFILGLPDVPSYETTHDTLFWNAHRVYGSIRWPIVTTNWDPIGYECKEIKLHGLYALKRVP